MRITSGEDVGILDEDGNSVIRAEYQYIGMFGENGFAPVEKDGEWYYIDTNGYKRRQPDETYEYLGTFNEGVLPAKKNGKYGFLDEDFNEKTEFEYDAATPMLNGIAAVKKDEKWALIDKDLKIITDFGFDDVVRDAWGFCSRNGVVFVKPVSSISCLTVPVYRSAKIMKQFLRLFQKSRSSSAGWKMGICFIRRRESSGLYV